MANIHRLGDFGDANPQGRNMRLGGNNAAFPFNLNNAPDGDNQGINIPFMSNGRFKIVICENNLIIFFK